MDIKKIHAVVCLLAAEIMHTNYLKYHTERLAGLVKKKHEPYGNLSAINHHIFKWLAHNHGAFGIGFARIAKRRNAIYFY